MKSIKLKSIQGRTLQISVQQSWQMLSALRVQGTLSLRTQVTSLAYLRILLTPDIQKYKEVTEFIKKLRVCDMYVISPDELITYESLSPSLTKAYTLVIQLSIYKDLKGVDFKSRCSGFYSGSVGGSYVKSNVTCHKCDKKGHIQKYCTENVTGSSGNSPNKYTNYLPEWVTKKPVVSDTKDLAPFTMTPNIKKYKWCTFCNNNNDTWGFQWKDGHFQWENKQGKKSYVHVPIPLTMQEFIAPSLVRSHLSALQNCVLTF